MRKQALIQFQWLENSCLFLWKLLPMFKRRNCWIYCTRDVHEAEYCCSISLMNPMMAANVQCRTVLSHCANPANLLSHIKISHILLSKQALCPRFQRAVKRRREKLRWPAELGREGVYGQTMI